MFFPQMPSHETVDCKICSLKVFCENIIYQIYTYLNNTIKETHSNIIIPSTRMFDETRKNKKTMFVHG